MNFPGHVPPRARKAADVGAVPADTNVSMTFNLYRHNQKGMDQMVQRIYTPGDPLFHHYLSVEERTNMFSPTEQEVMTVARFAQSKGFTVVNVSSDRTFVQASGKASQVQKGLGINLRRYHDKAAFYGDFFAPDRDPQVPISISKLVQGISGLTDANRPEPKLVSDPSSWWPFDNGLPAAFIRTVYGLNGLTLNGKRLNGSGQTVALVEFGDLDTSNLDGYIKYNAKGYDTSDLAWNGTQITLSKPTVVKIGSAPLNDVETEAELDLNMLVALADGLSTVYVYEGSDLGTIVKQIKADNKTKVVSYSYGSKEIGYGTSDLKTLNQDFEELALQGINFFASSGDQGDYVPDDPHGSPHNYQKTVEVPANIPYVTGVGGTIIGFSQKDYSWNSETSWNNSANSAGGGGVSSYFPIPWYQKAYIDANPGSVLSDMLGGSSMYSFRSVPDVSLNARHFYSYSKGSGGPVGGTSASAPLWAAFTALVNQGRSILGEDSIGFINPVLYSLAANPTTYANDFHDINDYSNNANYVSTDGYQAVNGYDAVTGLGSFRGKNLIADLLLANHAWRIDLKVSVNGSNPVSSIEVGSGSEMTFTAKLSAAVPVDTTVVLAGSGSDHTPYGTITIPQGALSGSTEVTAPVVKIKNKLSIQGTFSIAGSNPVVSVTVDPLTVKSFTFPSAAIYSGNPGDTIYGTVLLNGPAPRDEMVSVQLQSPTGAVKFPTSIIIPKGSDTGSVKIQGINGSVGKEQKVQVWVNTLHTDIVSGIYKANLLIEPAPVVTGVTIVPRDPNGSASDGKVVSGLSATGTVTLQSPALGMGASMMVPSTYAGVHPFTFVIPAGATTGTFTLNTDQTLTDYTAQMEVETQYNTPASARVFSLKVLGHQPFVTTTTSVTSSAPTAVDGTPVTITITVKSNNGVPTGNINVDIPGSGLSTINIPLNANGQATIVMPTELSIKPGTYHFNVSYPGDGVYQASSGTMTEVLLTPSVVSLKATPTTAIQTQTIYYVAGVPAVSGLPFPTGTITFVDQGAGAGHYVTLGTMALDNAGLAFFSDNSLLPFQNHMIVANYSGDSNYPAGSNTTPVNVTINQCSVTGTLVADVNPVPLGQSVTYTATFTVPQGAAVPTGTVILVDNDNTIDHVTITAANKGVVKFTEAPQSAGIHNMQAQFIANVPGLVGEGDLTLNVSGSLGQTSFGTTTTTTRSTSNKSVTVNVTLKDIGSKSAGDVTITSATLKGSGTGTALPLVIGTFNPSDSKTFSLQFGNIPKGSQTLVLKGTYNDGTPNGATFSQTVTVKVPN